VSEAEAPKGIQRSDLLVYACVGLLLLVGGAGQATWQASDPRIEVWAAWHEARGEPLDPWGTPFREGEEGIRSAGPDGTFDASPEDGDDVWVPRVPPSELGAYRLLGWLPWVAAIALAFSWEALRWLRRPSGGLWAELPLAGAGGAAAGVAAWGAVYLLASQERAVNELAESVAGGLFVSPAVALGGSVAICTGLLLLALRLRPTPELEAPPPGAEDPSL
jgi:hypothetical protein